MSRESELRIRQLAIVLQSLDSTTARTILSQLPAPQNRSVKQALANLGTVSTKERAAAMQDVGRLFAPSNHNPEQGRTSDASSSPATELLAMRSTASVDRIELSRPAYDHDHAEGVASVSSNSISSNTNPPGQLHSEQSAASLSASMDEAWKNVSAEDMVFLLGTERPNVIATVINSISVQRATAILQLLPMKLASDTLAALPHLHLADPDVLADIQSEIQRKIGMYQRPRAASQAGLSKLKAIVENLPSDQRGVWSRAIAQSDPTLVQQLGWHQPDWHQPGRQAEHVPTTVTNKPKLDPSQLDQIDLLDDSMIIPITRRIQTADEPSGSSPHRALPSNNEFDRLLHLSDTDLVAVLHASEPRTVLLAISGASKKMVARIERLMPGKDVKRLRDRLARIGVLSLREVDSAQLTIVDIAHAKIALGAIGPLSTVSFTAAA